MKNHDPNDPIADMSEGVPGTIGWTGVNETRTGSGVEQQTFARRRIASTIGRFFLQTKIGETITLFSLTAFVSATSDVDRVVPDAVDDVRNFAASQADRYDRYIETQWEERIEPLLGDENRESLVSNGTPDSRQLDNGDPKDVVNFLTDGSADSIPIEVVIGGGTLAFGVAVAGTYALGRLRRRPADSHA